MTVLVVLAAVAYGLCGINAVRSDLAIPRERQALERATPGVALFTLVTCFVLWPLIYVERLVRRH